MSQQTTSYSCSGFLRWLTSAIVIGLISAVAFIVLVDPYGLYQVFNQPGLNIVKPALSRYINEIKLTHAVKLKPDTLIFGNSRAQVGFDPESPALIRRERSAYNLAIPGTSISNSLSQLKYLIDKGIKPKTILLGLEFLDFMALPQSFANNKTPPMPSVQQVTVESWFWRFDCLFSMASFKDSLRTLLIQSDAEAAMVTSRGFNPLREYRVLARSEGYHALFRQKALEYAKTFIKQADGSLSQADLTSFRAILDYADESGAEVILLIYPYHSQILALFEETGLWKVFEHWKDLAMAEISAVRQNHADARITLVDFSGFGTYQCEQIPIRGDLKTSTLWYWEAGHFKKELGDAVLEKALTLSDEKDQFAAVRSAFGVKLEERTAGFNRERIARERAECANVYPQLFLEAKEMVDSARNNKTN